MAFSKKTIKDIDVAGKTVLVRVDYNLPVTAGKLGDVYRIEASLPTIKYLMQQKCKIILISHLGRPNGKPESTFSLEPVASKLFELLGHKVQFIRDCIGKEVEEAVSSMSPGHILLLENLRFHKEEEANDDEFAKKLAALAEVFVQDGFGVVHRAHASTDAITRHLPSVAGLLLEKEVTNITAALDNPKQPLLVILGGAKVSDKIDLIEKFISIAKQLVVGGAMANTFLKQMGYNIGKSVYEKTALEDAKRLRSQAEAAGVGLYLPTADVAVARQRTPQATRTEKPLTEVREDEYILDYGPRTIGEISKHINKAGSVIWNGPIGVTEFSNFTSGSIQVADAIKNAKVPAIAGGGDTAAFLSERKLTGAFEWVSTGGGAALELMAGKTLPGVKALQDK